MSARKSKYPRHRRQAKRRQYPAQTNKVREYLEQLGELARGGDDGKS